VTRSHPILAPAVSEEHHRSPSPSNAPPRFGLVLPLASWRSRTFSSFRDSARAGEVVAHIASGSQHIGRNSTGRSPNNRVEMRADGVRGPCHRALIREPSRSGRLMWARYSLPDSCGRDGRPSQAFFSARAFFDLPSARFPPLVGKSRSLQILKPMSLGRIVDGVGRRGGWRDGPMTPGLPWRPRGRLA